MPVALFTSLLAAVRRVGKERLAHTYQTTFWYPRGQKPTNVVDQAAAHIAKRLKLGPHIIGAEWWLSRMRTSNVQVDFHRDRDEKRVLAGGRLIHPTLSTVLFLNRCRGGLLAVTAEPPCDDNVALAPQKIDFDLVTPVPNRLAVFEGNRTHGVLDAGNQIPGRRLPLQRSWRLTIPINYWHRRPLDVPRYEQTRAYRSLSLAP
ncbi:MAG: hypothetical protein K1X64_15055 [Myxococcaceae bacterium]|nr:hypothetical protein [Myxococcaceae bacterium]